MSVSIAVVGTDDKPVDNAQVVVTDIVSGDEHVLRTNAAGTITENVANDVSMRYSRLIAVYVPGCALCGALLEPGQNTIHLQSAGSCAGKVIDEDGHPMAGVAVTLRDVTSSFRQDSWDILVPHAWQESYTVHTGDDGIFTFTNVPLTGRAYVELTDARYVCVHASFVYGKGMPPGPSLQARPGATLVGKAVFEDGTPAAAVRLFAMMQGETPLSDDGYYARTVTAADGSFQLTGLATGAFHVGLYRPVPEWTAANLTDVPAREGKEHQVAPFTLTHGVLIESTVKDVDFDKPIPGISVTAMNKADPDKGSSSMLTNMSLWKYNGRLFEPERGISWARTDATGHCTFRVPEGRYQIAIHDVPGYCLPDDGVRMNVDATGPAVKPVSIALSKGLTITGKVQDTQGKPVAQLPIAVRVIRDDPGNWQVLWSSGQTGEDGTFRISGLAAGQASIFLYDFGEIGEWQLISDVTAQLPAVHSIDIKVRKAVLYTLAGHVVTPQGALLPGVGVMVNITNSFDDGMKITQPAKCISDLTGRFTLAQLAPTAVVSFEAASCTGYYYLSGGKISKTDGHFQMQDIVLAPLSSKLSGVVRTAAGMPVAGARVIAPAWDGEAKTDAHGRFTLDHLPAGEVSLLAVHDRAAARIQALTDNKDVVLTLVESITP